MDSIRRLGPEDWLFRPPRTADALAIHRLVSECPPLDLNSVYLYLLQCTHFANTCVVAELDHTLRGWLSAYLDPSDPSRLFIWQVAVHMQVRRSGLALRMALSLMERTPCQHVRFVTATVTPSNVGSQALFASIAATLDTHMSAEPYFERDTHFGGAHESEDLITIGPINPLSKSKRIPLQWSNHDG